MAQSIIYPVASQETVHFIEALAAAAGAGTQPFVASAIYNVPGVPAVLGRRFIIRAIEIVDKENVGYEVNYFASGVALGTDPQLDSFLGRFTFTSAMGVRAGGANLWRYYKEGLAIPYYDLDWAKAGAVVAGVNVVPNPPTLHMMVQNADTVAKSAGVPGQVVITTWLEPQQGY